MNRDGVSRSITLGSLARAAHVPTAFIPNRRARRVRDLARRPLADPARDDLLERVSRRAGSRLDAGAA